jgi:hypothetical protein
MAESEKPRDKVKEIGRREFLAGSGVAIAAGVLATGIPVLQCCCQ